MPLPPLDQLKELQSRITPGQWTVGENYFYGTCVANEEGHRRGYGKQVIFNFEAGVVGADPQLVALAPDILAEVIRLREALEKQLNEVNFVIALVDMILPQTEAQQKATTLARALRDDLTRILEGRK